MPSNTRRIKENQKGIVARALLMIFLTQETDFFEVLGHLYLHIQTLAWSFRCQSPPGSLDGYWLGGTSIYYMLT